LNRIGQDQKSPDDLSDFDLTDAEEFLNIEQNDFFEDCTLEDIKTIMHLFSKSKILPNFFKAAIKKPPNYKVLKGIYWILNDAQAYDYIKKNDYDKLAAEWAHAKRNAPREFKHPLLTACAKWLKYPFFKNFKKD
jgi:hypothetical protein